MILLTGIFTSKGPIIFHDEFTLISEGVTFVPLIVTLS